MTVPGGEDGEGLALSVLAGEAVLGFGSPEDRAAIAARFSGDGAFAREVAAWERRLAPLAHLVPEAVPPAALWPRIASATVGAAQAAAAPAPAPGVVIDLEQAVAARTRALEARVARWRRAAGGLAAIAAALAVLVGVGPERLRQLGVGSAPTGERYLGVVSASGDTPPLVVAVDLASGQLAVRALQVRPDAGKSFELWGVPPGGKPISLGVLDDKAPHAIAPIAPSAWRDPSFLLAVSVEPKGGSPTGVATGPVVYTGKLIAAP